MEDSLKKKQEKLLDMQIAHMEQEKKINELSNKMTPYLIVICIALACVAGWLIAGLK